MSAALVDLAVRLGGALVEAGIVAYDRRSQTEALLLAELRASPPEDVALDYELARKLVLGPRVPTKEETHDTEPPESTPNTHHFKDDEQ